MRVVVHPADEGGCGHYRLTWPARALAEQGHDVDVRVNATYPVVHEERAFGAPAVLGLADPKAIRSAKAEFLSEETMLNRRNAPTADRVKFIRRWHAERDRILTETGPGQLDGDVYVFQRPLQRTRVEFIEAIQKAGAAVVVEVDDDFHAVHRLNPAWRGTNPLADADYNRDWLKRACERADLVTVSTPALAARYGAHGRVRVLPNCVPERYLSIVPGAYTDVHFGPKADGVTVGWSGSVSTHPKDLQETGGGVARAVRETGARFEVVGTGKGVKSALGLDVEPDATGWLPLDAYPEALARFDIGIVPLLPSEFNEAKSALKGLEMAAVGVPAVLPPTAPYREFAALAHLPIAWNADEWYRWTGMLISQERMRESHAHTAKEAARRLTVEGNAWRWAEAWAGALTNRRATVAA